MNILKKGRRMKGYHVTTNRKLEKYLQSKCILPPVRFWPNEYTAEKWRKRVNRDIILEIDIGSSYPLPDHKPARWTEEIIRDWKILRKE